jgi:hypothetical protein
MLKIRYFEEFVTQSFHRGSYAVHGGAGYDRPCKAPALMKLAIPSIFLNHRWRDQLLATCMDRHA